MKSVIPFGEYANHPTWEGPFCTEDGQEIIGLTRGLKRAHEDEEISGFVLSPSGEHEHFFWDGRGRTNVGPDIFVGVPAGFMKESFVVYDRQKNETRMTDNEQSAQMWAVEGEKFILKINSDFSLSWVEKFSAKEKAHV